VRDDLSILNRQLHTFQVSELQELRRVSDNIFEPLMRPFRQKRAIQEFSFKKSLRMAQRIGAFMPTYEKNEREHRKSRLVIAMSLAGIDRCSAVSLIPLFSCLKETALDFNFYVYTDDLIKAEFTHDGFLANDYQIAWNNVAGPAVMQRLSDLETESQEDILLIIDSLGGGDSRWFEYWSYEERQEVREEQMKYLATAGKYSCYNRIRRQLDGDFSKMKEVKLPEEWRKKVENNTQHRWMQTPALEEYMVRWVFNPRFGDVPHGSYSVPYVNAFQIMRKLKGKFRQIHLLTPNNQGNNRFTLEKLLKVNVVDYHHKANTIYGFATVLSNIVHGQCPFDGPFTKKVSYEIVKFSEFKGEEEEDLIAENDEAGEHTNLKASGQCFDQCPIVTPSSPSITTVKLSKKVRGASVTQTQELPFNELDIEDFLPIDMSLNVLWKDKILPVDFEIEKGDSEYTRLRKAEEVYDTIRSYQIVFKYGIGHKGLVREKRPLVVQADNLHAILKGIEYNKHHTSTLQNSVEEFFLMLSPAYHSYLNDLALKHVIWCSVSQYAQQHRAISVNPKQNIEGRKNCSWHELGHHLESVCPPIGVFTNELLRRKGGKYDRKKLVQVGSGGEWAMPVSDGSADWIKPYAGKWYKRNHVHLPNDTEIISVYSEYFTSKERLVHLIKHDPNMVRFMAFVYMGGPVAAMQALQELKRREVLQQITQKSRSSSGYGGGRGGGGGGGSGGRAKPNRGFGL
jgi:uncharacterized membrane protein YgcG